MQTAPDLGIASTTAELSSKACSPANTEGRCEEPWCTHFSSLCAMCFEAHSTHRSWQAGSMILLTFLMWSRQKKRCGRCWHKPRRQKKPWWTGLTTSHKASKLVREPDLVTGRRLRFVQKDVPFLHAVESRAVDIRSWDRTRR